MTKLLAACALAAMTFAVASPRLNAADAQCPLGNATKHGTYMMSGTGTIVDVGLISIVGETTYDGEGNTSTTLTASENGTIYKGLTVSGTYTVNPDCTGSVTETNGQHFDFVVAPDGNTSMWLETDTGTVVPGTELLLKHSAELTQLNRDGVEIPLGGAAIPGSLATMLSNGQPQVRLGDFFSRKPNVGQVFI